MIFDQGHESDPLGGLGSWGQKVKIHTLSEHGQVENQIQGNHECSNIVANILATDPFPSPPPSPTLGMGSIDLNSTFSEHRHVPYQI